MGEKEFTNEASDVSDYTGMFFADDSTGYFPQKHARKLFKKGQRFEYVNSDGIRHEGRIIEVKNHEITVHFTRMFVPGSHLKDGCR